MTKHVLLASLLFPTLSQGSGILIDVNFPDGTGTNPNFLEIDNGVGDNTWTQATGVFSSSTSNNSSIGAASETVIDFSTLGGEKLVLTANVSSVSGTLVANGMFVGFQRRINGGIGSDLWNNLATSFGMVIPGSAAVGNGVRHVGIGGNAGTGRYQAFDYGIASAASIQDGFDVTLSVDINGWDLAIAGLEADDATPIVGGSGTWDTGGINAWGAFDADMRVGSSFQTTAGAGDLTFSRITLEQVAVPEPSSIALAGIAALGFLRRRR
jgi:hypothetical protein